MQLPRVLVLTLTLCLLSGSFSKAQDRTAKSAVTPQVFSWPLQVEMRIPQAPSAFPSGDKSYLLYELCLTNFGSAPVTLNRVEVLDASLKASHPLASFGADALQSMVQPIGRNVAVPAERMRLAGGEGVILFMAVEADRKVGFPNRIAHRITTDSASLEGAVVETQRTQLHVLGPPVRGGNWLAADGPGNTEDNHHRRGSLILGGTLVDSRRFAIDWKQTKAGNSFVGDSKDVHSYFCYGKPVYAVADGQVLRAKDGLPDNVPGHGADFHPAVPIDFETIAGNSITLDLGGGEFAYFMHLQPGSLLVKPGDHVKKGQLLAVIGASGDAREPHLHFEVTTSPVLLMGEGVPYVFDRYETNEAEAGSKPLSHKGELPLNNTIVSFSSKN